MIFFVRFLVTDFAMISIPVSGYMLLSHLNFWAGGMDDSLVYVFGIGVAFIATAYRRFMVAVFVDSPESIEEIRFRLWGTEEKRESYAKALGEDHRLLFPVEKE